MEVGILIMPLKNPKREIDSSRIKIKSVKFAKCHPDRKVQARGLCKSCYNKWLIKNNPEYAERQKENNKRWVNKHKARVSKYQKDYSSKQDETLRRNRVLLSNYGITLNEYNWLLEKQNHCCNICKTHVDNLNKNLAVDHNHETGEIRGLLCFRCNFGMSYFSENTKTLQNAIDHLENGSSIHNELHEIMMNREEKELSKKEEMDLIVYHAKKSGIKMSEEIKADIINLYQSGSSINSIYKKYSWLCSRQVITRRLKKWGVKKDA